MLKQKRISCQNLVPYDFWHQIFAHPEIYRFFLRHGRKVGPRTSGTPGIREPLEPGRQEL